MTWDQSDKERKYVEIYYVNPRTGKAHTMVACALGGDGDMQIGNVIKVPKEDAPVEIEEYCGSCCYKKKDVREDTQLGDK